VPKEAPFALEPAVLVSQVHRHSPTKRRISKWGDENTNGTLLFMYQNNEGATHTVERVQTGLRIEKRILKVMKALAEYHDLTLGDLIEGIVLHAFEGKSPFGSESLKLIVELKRIYHLDLDAGSSHKLIEREAQRKKRR
jgi:hypothetical protein